MPPILWTFATGWRRVSLVFFGVAALVAASFGLVHLGSSRITEAAAASRFHMPAKKPSASKAAAAATGENDARADALERLHAAGDDWWDGIEVTVPWAAVSAAHAARDDTWVGLNMVDEGFTRESRTLKPFRQPPTVSADLTAPRSNENIGLYRLRN